MGLMIGFGALETRQETVVDIDAAAGQIGGKIIGQYLHVTGKHHQFCSGVFDDLLDLRFLLSLGVAGNGEVIIGDVGIRGQVQHFLRMVGDNGDGLHVQFANAHPVEKIAHAMVEFRHQDQDFSPAVSRSYGPFHIEGCCRGRKVGFKFLRRLRQCEFDPHEKMAGLGIIKLLGFNNIAAIGEEFGRNFRHNAGPVGATYCQYVFFHESGFLCA